MTTSDEGHPQGRAMENVDWDQCTDGKRGGGERMPNDVPPIVVMGVQGSGKSTIGAMLGARLGFRFIDGDALHSAGNIAKMAAGIPLTDEDRLPWLAEVARTLVDGRDEGIVVVCSALKRSYRDILRAAVPDLFVVDPIGPIELIAARIRIRHHEYMPTELLQSQFDTLEPLEADERGIRVDINRSRQGIIDDVVRGLEADLGVRIPAASARLE